VTPEELREKTEDELKKLHRDLREELFRLKIKKSTGQLDKTHGLSLLKRDIARINTLASERKSGEKK
jgi:large subunit ribosomal protein L29